MAYYCPPAPYNPSDYIVHRVLARLTREKRMSMRDAARLGRKVRAKHGLCQRREYSFEQMAVSDFYPCGEWFRGELIHLACRREILDAYEEAGCEGVPFTRLPIPDLRKYI